MMRKHIILIIVLILIVLISFVSLINFNQNNVIEIEGDTFSIPDGYYEGKNNSVGDVNLTNGTNSVFIAKYNNSNITNYIKYYNDSFNGDNHTIIMSNFTIDNLIVYKSINKDKGSNHYWFVKNNHVYSIYNWDKNPNMDKIVMQLISSLYTKNQ